jgi:hypothetical protein
MDRIELRPQRSKQSRLGLKMASLSLCKEKEKERVNPEEFPSPEPYKPAPEYILDEMDFLKFVAGMLYDGCYASNEDIKEYYEECYEVSYKSVYGKTPIDTLLGWRSGIYFDKGEQAWYTNPVEFTIHISKIHMENEDIYGKDYDRPWLFQDEWD